MQDALGITLLLGIAILFRLCFHSTTGLSFQRHDVIHVLSFSVLAFWVLSLVAGIWLLAAGVALAVRPR
jgi:hypothetical protein